jgi:two-component system sensor histidine kinase KdpD
MIDRRPVDTGLLVRLRVLLRSETEVARPRRVLLTMLGVAAALAAATLLVAIAEAPPLSIPDASPIYLVAIVAVAIGLGPTAAIVSAFGSFLLYDVLFISPRLTLTVRDPDEWLNLLLFLFVAVTIGRLTASQTARAADATRRLRESQALFRISRTLATASTIEAALPTVLQVLLAETAMARIWLTRMSGGLEIVIADTDPTKPLPVTSIQTILARTPGDEPARWVRAHVPAGAALTGPAASGQESYRVRMGAEGEIVGSLAAVRERSHGLPGRGETRLFSLAADQLGLAYQRRRLVAEANAAEVARQSEALKSALLDSVSHDLRTPLASIRAAAGAVMDPSVAWSDDDARAALRSIESETERMDRLVRNLLDLSRIDGGALQPDFEVYDLAELLEPVVARLGSAFASASLSVDLPADLPPVRVDAVYLDEAVTNLLDNAARHAHGAPVRIGATASGTDRVRLVVEDGGQGVPPEDVAHMFERFYRVRRTGEGSRRGLGIGLSVVKGLVEAMGGTVRAEASSLGGLAVSLDLPAVPAPPEEAGAA